MEILIRSHKVTQAEMFKEIHVTIAEDMEYVKRQWDIRHEKMLASLLRDCQPYVEGCLYDTARRWNLVIEEILG